MARRTTTPASPSPAPLPAEIMRHPTSFARALAATPVQFTRYLPAPLLAAALSGLAYALLVRPAVNLAAGGGFTFATHATNVIGGVFLGLLAFLVQWGLGQLAVRREGRAAEVYAATYTLVIPVLIVAVALTFMDGTPAVPPGTPAAQVERAALRSLTGTPAAQVLMLAAVLGTALQSALAFVVFRTLTGSVGRAAGGALLPLVPAVAVQALGLAPLLLNR